MSKTKYNLGDEVNISFIGKVVGIELRNGIAYYTVRELDGDNKQTFHPFAFIDEESMFALPSPEIFENNKIV